MSGRTISTPGFSTVRRLHVATDCVLVSIGWLGAYGLRRALVPTLGPINAFETYVAALPLIVVPWILTGWVFGLYRSQRMKTLVDELQSVFRSAALGLLVAVASRGPHNKKQSKK